MQFYSLGFFLFYPIILLLYYRVSEKYRGRILLIASVLFYICFGLYGLGILLLCTLISFFGGRILRQKKAKSLLLLFCVLTLCPLAILKYICPSNAFALPVGISFFTLQGISYLADCYRNDEDKSSSVSVSFWDYLLYMTFFPTVLSGPIKREADFSGQLSKSHVFSYEAVRSGLLRMGLGYLEKVFLADGTALLVDYVYKNPQERAGSQILVATILFGLQLYFDFAGYSHIAIGISQTFGIPIDENFSQPYFATSIKEFWRRWHISLSSWLRDYIYIPLGGSRAGKGKKYINLMITFLVSGIWHGAGLQFLLWGALHGIYQILGEALVPFRKKIRKLLHISERSPILRVWQSLVVFALVDFAWLFFRVDNLENGIYMVQKIATEFNGAILFSSWWFQGLNKLQLILWTLSFGLVFIYDFLAYRKTDALQLLSKKPLLIRWFFYLAVIFIILVGLLMSVGSNVSGFVYQNF